MVAGQLGFSTGGQGRAGGAYHAIQHSELIRPIQSPPGSTTAEPAGVPATRS